MGWLPVGTSLLEPRAESVVVPLDEDQLLVLGGWSGRLPDEKLSSRTAEICEPRRPDRRRQTDPPFGEPACSLDGVGAIRIADGRVLAVLGDQVSIFDPEGETWTPQPCLVSSRRGAGLLSLGPDGRDGLVDAVLVVGGHQAGRPSIETIDIPRNGPTISRAWSDDALPVVRDVAIARGGDCEVIVAGGLVGTRSTPLTWRIDPRSKSVRPGPTLPEKSGVTGAQLISRGSRLLLLGGESRTTNGPRPVRGMVVHPLSNRVILLPSAPRPAVRSTVIETPNGYLVTGGYRFDASAPRGSRTKVLATADLLTIPTIAIAD